MKEAIKQAGLAYKKNEVPIGAVIVKDNLIIGEGHNHVIHDLDISSHAEINAIRHASKKIKNYRLNNCDMYVTIEPCPMCAYAIAKSHVGKLYFGCEDTKGGGVINGPRIFEYKNLKKIEFVSHCFDDKTSQLMTDFFKIKRNQQL